MRVAVKVDATKGTNEFKAARRDINQRVKMGLEAAAKEEALPAAKARAPGFARPMLIAKATTRSAYITARGPRPLMRAVGLLEFGGTVKTPIMPRNKKAVGPGSWVVARIVKPRRYQAQLRLTKAVESRREGIDAKLLHHVLKAFDGFDTSD